MRRYQVKIKDNGTMYFVFKNISQESIEKIEYTFKIKNKKEILSNFRSYANSVGPLDPGESEEASVFFGTDGMVITEIFIHIGDDKLHFKRGFFSWKLISEPLA